MLVLMGLTLCPSEHHVIPAPQKRTQMTNLVQANIKTMSSFDLYKIIREERANNGEPIPRINDFNARVIDELEGENYETFVVQNSNKTKSTVFNLTIDQCMLIGMRESKSVRKSVLCKLKALEEPETPEQLMARALISAQSVIEDKNRQLEEAKPAIELHNSIVNDDETLSMRDAGKRLQVKPNKFVEWLRGEKYITHANLAYQSHINAGYLVLSTTEHNGKPRTNTRVTGKGFAHFGKKIAQVKFTNPSHELFYK